MIGDAFLGSTIPPFVVLTLAPASSVLMKVASESKASIGVAGIVGLLFIVYEIIKPRTIPTDM
jgi:hypothetical protein